MLSEIPFQMQPPLPLVHHPLKVLELLPDLPCNFWTGRATHLNFWMNRRSNFIAEAKKRPEIANAFTLYRSNVPQKQIVIDYDKAEKLNIDQNEITSTISTYLGASYVNDFNRFGRQYKVFVQAEAEDRLSPDDIARYYVRNRTGEIIPLNTLAQVEDITGPSYTNRFNMFRAAEISGAPAEGYSSADALKCTGRSCCNVAKRTRYCME